MGKQVEVTEIGPSESLRKQLKKISKKKFKAIKSKESFLHKTILIKNTIKTLKHWKPIFKEEQDELDEFQKIFENFRVPPLLDASFVCSNPDTESESDSRISNSSEARWSLVKPISESNGSSDLSEEKTLVPKIERVNENCHTPPLSDASFNNGIPHGNTKRYFYNMNSPECKMPLIPQNLLDEKLSEECSSEPEISLEETTNNEKSNIFTGAGKNEDIKTESQSLWSFNRPFGASQFAQFHPRDLDSEFSYETMKESMPSMFSFNLPCQPFSRIQSC